MCTGDTLPRPCQKCGLGLVSRARPGGSVMTWWWAGMVEPAGQALWLAWGVVAGVATGGALCRRWLDVGVYRSVAQYLPPVGVLLAGLVVLWPGPPGAEASVTTCGGLSPSILSGAEPQGRDAVPAGRGTFPVWATVHEVADRETPCGSGMRGPSRQDVAVRPYRETR